MKLRFLMSCHRENSVRDKVIGKKLDLFREKHTSQSLGNLRRREAPKYGVVSFYGLGNFIG